MLPHLSIAPVIFSVKIPVNNCIPNENAEKEIKPILAFKVCCSFTILSEMNDQKC